MISEAKTRLKCRASLYEFVKAGWHVKHGDAPFIGGWHIEEVCRLVQVMLEELMQARRDEAAGREPRMREQNLLINIPPRSSKTMIVQVYAIAWLWLHDPTVKVRCLSGTPSVVNDSGRDCLEVIQSEWYRNTFRSSWSLIKPVGVTKFRNTVGGERSALGVQASITGAGSDIIIMDDPNDAEAVQSEKERAGVNKKWSSSIRNRLNNAKARLRIGIMQRLHEVDWSGHVLQADDWIHAKIPMEYERINTCPCATCTGRRVPAELFRLRDPRTEDGELMQPERFDREFCDNEKRNLGSYGYAGQMQQRPAPDEGGMFKKDNWRFWYGGNSDTAQAGIKVADTSSPDTRPRGCYKGAARALPDQFHEIIISVDTTFGTQLATSDYVAMYVVGRHGTNRYILDRVHAKIDYPSTKAAFVELAKRWPRAFRKVIERAASGVSMIQDLDGEVGGMVGFTPAEHGTKVQRAHRMSGPQEAGDWYLPEGAPWLESHILEFAVFPNGAHDDSVDACSQAEIAFQTSSYASTLTAVADKGRTIRAFG